MHQQLPFPVKRIQLVLISTPVLQIHPNAQPSSSGLDCTSRQHVDQPQRTAQGPNPDQDGASTPPTTGNHPNEACAVRAEGYPVPTGGLPPPMPLSHGSITRGGPTRHIEALARASRVSRPASRTSATLIGAQSRGESDLPLFGLASLVPRQCIPKHDHFQMARWGRHNEHMSALLAQPGEVHDDTR